APKGAGLSSAHLQAAAIIHRAFSCRRDILKRGFSAALFQGGTMRRRLLPLILLAMIAVSAGAPADAFEVGKNRKGDNLNGFELDTPDPQMCQDACDSQKQCKSWTFVNPGEESPNARCWLKSSAPAPV